MGFGAAVTIKWTLYQDQQAGRFVLIKWDGLRATHYKFPKGILTEDQAKREARKIKATTS